MGDEKTDEKTGDQILKGCGAIIIGILSLAALIVVSGLVHGYVFQHYWGWFVAPTFGIPFLTISQSWGLVVFIRYLTIHPAKPKDLTGKGAWAVIGAIFEGWFQTLVVVPMFLLFVGYVLFHGFIARG